MRKFSILLMVLSFSLSSQEIVWPESPGPVTALKIFCDTDSIPIYLDGQKIGLSPLNEPIQVAPGWHQVSYFPKGTLNLPKGSSEAVTMEDIVHLARQDILAEEGKITRVVLSYRTLEAEVQDYQAKLDSSHWLGLAMAVVILLILSWGVG